METYRIENLTFTYANQVKPAVNNINIKIDRGAFVALCGPSGCGKTALLKHLKPSIAPHGLKLGEIYFQNEALYELNIRDAVAKIGFVMQSPENQIVTDKVWHELAFGLESLGLKTSEIRLRVAEMASFFGIQTWFHKPVTELSGGQKQLLTLASVMALQPSVLILDEPTSQLDPIAAGEFLATLGKINKELGVTIILTEHRLEEVFPIATRTIVMDKGTIVEDGSPKEVAFGLRKSGNNMFMAMPTPMRVWMAVAKNNDTNDVPITSSEGASWLSKLDINKNQIEYDSDVVLKNPKIAIKIDEVWFKYEKHLPDIIKGLSFTINYGEITAVLGGNGTGKTTMLSLIAGLYKPYRGKIFKDTEVFVLPQNPQSLFVAKTVQEDLLEVLSGTKLSSEEKLNKLNIIQKMCHLEELLQSHPYDLSGGEQQRAALAKVLLLQPDILLLDEPTKGLDAEYKRIFATILKNLVDSGVAVVMVSHDLEFCAEYANRCALFFDGNIATENTPKKFFGGNSFYTTTANRMSRHVFPDTVTAGDLVLALGGEIPPPPDVLSLRTKKIGTDNELSIQSINKDVYSKNLINVFKMLSTTRKYVFTFFVLLIISGVVLAFTHWDNFMLFISGGQQAIAVTQGGVAVYISIMGLIGVGIAGMVLSLYWRQKAIFVQKKKQLLSKRTILAAALVLLTIPITIYIGVFFLDDRQFYFISMLIIFQTMLPFMLIFESRKPQAREIIVIAVLCAIAVAGRTAFFMLPQFKPVIAMVIIAGVAFGGEAGFLVGAMTGFVSNMFFGQGPWTPWQMFAFGIIGFLAGVLFRKGLLGREPLPLAVFGGLATFIIYGGIMNPASVIIWQPNPTLEMFILAYLMGIPFDFIHAVATVFFLVIISKPMLEKLDRIKVKYGLIE